MRGKGRSRAGQVRVSGLIPIPQLHSCHNNRPYCPPSVAAATALQLQGEALRASVAAFGELPSTAPLAAELAISEPPPSPPPALQVRSPNDAR